MNDCIKSVRNVDAKAIIGEVLNYVGLKAPSFAREIGISYQRIFDLQSGRTKKFNPSVVDLIVARWPEIDKRYLYTGEGSLLIPEGYLPESLNLDGVSTVPAGHIAEILSLQHQLMQMFQAVTEKENYCQRRLTDLINREREVGMREAELNKREFELDRREAELNSLSESLHKSC